RAAVARGKYQEAEAQLRPIAQRAPTSDAALQLGLLLQRTGKPEAKAILTRVASVAETSDTAADLARGAIPPSTPPGAICSSRNTTRPRRCGRIRRRSARINAGRRRCSARLARSP